MMKDTQQVLCLKTVKLTDTNDRYLYDAFTEGKHYRTATLEEQNANPPPEVFPFALINFKLNVHYMNEEFFHEHFRIITNA